MDTFSDIEIFCDLLEVMQKRSVSVYLLLDHQRLPIFLEMCNNIQINGSHLPVSCLNNLLIKYFIHHSVVFQG